VAESKSNYDKKSRIRSFFHLEHQPDEARAASTAKHVPHALEDLPDEEVRGEARRLLAAVRELERDVPERPTEDTSFRRVLFDSLDNFVSGLWGEAERIEFLHLASLHPVRPYTYVVSQELVRGSRPSSGDLQHLSTNGIKTTISLCKEMEDEEGDLANITKADLIGTLEGLFYPITDSMSPTSDQVIEFLDAVKDETRCPAYVHCEAGVGRTGVMVACYRMGVMGWSRDHAATEAHNFGLSTPDQREFIEMFAAELEEGRYERYGFPVMPLGTTLPTAEQLVAEKGSPPTL
jgi:protein-tyrosine phosphatase